MTSPTEESSSKLASSSKKKLKEKQNMGNSLKGSISNSLFSNSSNISRMDASELPSFQADRSSSSDGKMSYLKNHTTEVNSSSSVKGNKKKSGSESSTSGSIGGQGSSSNSTHADSGRKNRPQNRTGRGFSSGSSDGEDDREKEQKQGLSQKTKGSKPVKPGPLESDDEATDSADEGNSGGEERGGRRRGEISGGMLRLRRSDRSVSRKDSSESTNSATSPAPILNSALTTGTIFVESALPKEPMVGPSSPVNMAVGYGASDSMAPSVFDKTPTQSPLGTPTMDSPKLISDRQRSPGTPIPISPSTEATEVCVRPVQGIIITSCNVNVGDYTYMYVYMCMCI